MWLSSQESSPFRTCKYSSSTRTASRSGRSVSARAPAAARAAAAASSGLGSFTASSASSTRIRPVNRSRVCTELSSHLQTCQCCTTPPACCRCFLCAWCKRSVQTLQHPHQACQKKVTSCAATSAATAPSATGKRPCAHTPHSQALTHRGFKFVRCSRLTYVKQRHRWRTQRRKRPSSLPHHIDCCCLWSASWRH